MTSRLARDPARRCMRLAEWPDADRERWLAALQLGDPLESDGARARYAAASNRRVEHGYGRWLAWLAHTGRLDRSASPAARINREAVVAYLRALAVVNSTATQHGRLEELYIVAVVMAPDQDWKWIRNLASGVRLRHRPAREKRPRLVGTDDLLALGFTLIRHAGEEKGSPRQRALLHRDGLAIGLLALRLLRRRNFVHLHLSEHVVRRGEEWWLQVPGSETKNGDPIEMRWPKVLVEPLETYLTLHRPELAGRQSRWCRPAGQALWVSAEGTPMGEQALYMLVKKHTRAAFGRDLSPHLFRDCATTTIAIEDPGRVGIASQLLTHRSPAAVERYYNQARSVAAVRKWHEILAGLRDG